MSRIAEIVHGLYLCDMHATTNADFRGKISVFVAVCQAPYEEWEMFVRDIRDRLVVIGSITRDCAKVLEKIEAYLHRGDRIAVFCESGEQRAPSMIAAYLITEAKLGVDAAVAVVHSKFRYAFPSGCRYVSLLHVLRNQMEP